MYALFCIKLTIFHWRQTLEHDSIRVLTATLGKITFRSRSLGMICSRTGSPLEFSFSNSQPYIVVLILTLKTDCDQGQEFFNRFISFLGSLSAFKLRSLADIHVRIARYRNIRCMNESSHHFKKSFIINIWRKYYSCNQLDENKLIAQICFTTPLRFVSWRSWNRCSPSTPQLKTQNFSNHNVMRLLMHLYHTIILILYRHHIILIILIDSFCTWRWWRARADWAVHASHATSLVCPAINAHAIALVAESQ